MLLPAMPQPSPLPFLPPPAIVIKEEPKKPEPKLYTIVEHDTLEKVASEQHTTVQKLFSKNTVIVDPNVIEVGLQLTIPTDEEVLAERPMPIQGTQSFNQGGSTPTLQGFSSSGNTYYAGYCTWYAKQMRPDLPNNLGNADTWFSRAAAQGIPTGTTPRVGAIAQTKGAMHVSYVTGISGSNIILSEMNYVGFGVVSSRVAPASNFLYIY